MQKQKQQPPQKRSSQRIIQEKPSHMNQGDQAFYPGRSAQKKSAKSESTPKSS